MEKKNKNEENILKDTVEISRGQINEQSFDNPIYFGALTFFMILSRLINEDEKIDNIIFICYVLIAALVVTRSLNNVHQMKKADKKLEELRKILKEKYNIDIDFKSVIINMENEDLCFNGSEIRYVDSEYVYHDNETKNDAVITKTVKESLGKNKRRK